MTSRRLILRSVAEIVSLAHAFRPLRPGLRILMYHSVGGHALGDTRGIFSISQRRFRSHIHQLSNMLESRAVPLQPLNLLPQSAQVAVTFDDGYLDTLRVAAPILVECGIPFTVFVSSDFIKNRTNGFLAPEELRELAGLPGVTIGAHGKSHCPLTSCNDSALKTELSSSKYYLEDLLGCSVTAIAYPFGAANIRVRDAVRQLGYNLGVCTRFNINTPGRDPLMLCRYNIECDDTPRVLRQKLHGDWDWYRWRSPDPLLQKDIREI